MIELEYRIAETCKRYPGLSYTEEDSGYLLSGILVLNAEYQDVPLYDEYRLDIHIPKEFPDAIPLVIDVEEKVPKNMEHFYGNGGLCLGANCEILDFITKDQSIIGFIDAFVMSYLYTASFFQRYHQFPYGERSHGVQGIEEAYADRYSCSDRELLMQLLLCLIGMEKIKGHHPCICGSNKRFRNCHGEQVLEDIQSKFSGQYKSDAYAILLNYLEEKKGR